MLSRSLWIKISGNERPFRGQEDGIGSEEYRQPFDEEAKPLQSRSRRWTLIGDSQMYPAFGRRTYR